MVNTTKYIRIFIMLAVCCTGSFTKAMLRTSPSVLSQKTSIFSKFNLGTIKLAPLMNGGLKLAHNIAIRASANMANNPKSCGILFLVCLAAMGYRYIPIPDMSEVKTYCKGGCDWVFDQCYQCLPLEAQKKVDAINTLIVAPVNTLVVSPLGGYILNSDNCKYVVLMAMCALAGYAAGWPNTGYVGSGTVFAYSLLLGGINRVETKVDAGFNDTRQQLEILKEKIVDAGKVNHEVLTKQIKDLDKKTQQSIQGVATQIDGLQGQLLKIDKKNNALSDQVGGAIVKIDDINQAVGNAVDQLSLMATNVKTVQVTLGQLEKNEQVQKKIIDELKSCVEKIEKDTEIRYIALDQKIQDVQQNLSDRLTLIEHGQGKLTDTVTNLAQIVEDSGRNAEEQFGSLSKQAQDHNIQLAATDEKVQGCVDKVEFLSNQVNANTGSLQAQNVVLQKVDQSQENLAAAVGDLKGSMASNSDKAAKQMSEFAQANKDTAAKLDKQGDILQSMQDSAREATERQEETDQKLSNQAQEIAYLRVALEKIEESQEQLKRGYDQIKISVDENTLAQQNVKLQMQAVKKDLFGKLEGVAAGQKADMEKLEGGFSAVANQVNGKLDDVLTTVTNLQTNGTLLSIDISATAPSTQLNSVPIASSSYPLKAPNFNRAGGSGSQTGLQHMLLGYLNQ